LKRDHGKYSDVHGSMDRGPKEFQHHMKKKEGEVMIIAEKKAVTTHPANSIKNVATLMLENDFRRIPVTNAGTGRLEGMAKAMDIIDFLGGGEKYNIILKDYKGNFLSAINCQISKIMSPVVFLGKKASVEDAVQLMLARRTSIIPIVEDEKSLKVAAIVTERDVLPTTDEVGATVSEVMSEDCVTATPGMMLSDVAKIMVRNKLRRLPVVSEDKVAGVVTQFDLLRFLSRGEFRGVHAEENLSVRVSDVMSGEVVSVSPRQDLACVISLVKETGLGGFPVIEKGKLVGIVTTVDIIRHIYRK
jgi:CBS domain-containing protein